MIYKVEPQVGDVIFSPHNNNPWDTGGIITKVTPVKIIIRWQSGLSAKRPATYDLSSIHTLLSTGWCLDRGSL